MGKQYIKWFAKLALFIIVFIVTDFIFGMSIKTLDKRAVELNPDANKTRYLLDDVCSDVLIVGASEVEFSYRPDIIMDSLGMTVYNCGKNGQRLYYQTTVVNSIIDRYSPKLIVWSIAPNCLTPYQGDLDRTSILKPYYHDNKYCKEILQKRSWNEKWKMNSYFYAYNSEFHSVIVNALHSAEQKTIYGYLPLPNGDKEPPFEEMQFDDNPDELCVILFSNIVRRLKEKGINVVFIFSPQYSYGDYHQLDSYKLLCTIINDNGYFLWEDFYHNSSLMHGYSFKDKDHLSEQGVKCFSQMVAHKLKISYFLI